MKTNLLNLIKSRKLGSGNISNGMNNELKKRIMFQIYIEYGKNIVRNNLHNILGVSSFLVFVTSVSLHDIYINISSTSIYSLFNFVKITLRDTEIITLILFAVTILFLVTSGLKIIRTSFHISRFKGIVGV